MNLFFFFVVSAESEGALYEPAVMDGKLKNIICTNRYNVCSSI